jgi:hypothetical protein
LEHYVVSSGHDETIRGSKVAPWIENIFAIAFLGNKIEEGARGFFEKIAKKSMTIDKKRGFF